MKICLVSAFPPSREPVNEYGYHLAHELQRNPFLSVTVLAEEHTDAEPELPDFDVLRCWRRDSAKSFWTLLKALREARPDIVWFNLVSSTFGQNSPLAAFMGICLPLLVRLAGYTSHVTLHRLADAYDTTKPSLRRTAWEWLTTTLLRCANSLTVLRPSFITNPEPPDFSARGNPVQRVVAFAADSHDSMETLLAACTRVNEHIGSVDLVIATDVSAADSLNMRKSTGVCHSMDADGRRSTQLERRTAELLKGASVAVLSHATPEALPAATVAAQFGVPIVCADAAASRALAVENDFALELFDAGNPASLAHHLAAVLGDRARQIEMAEQNFSAAIRLTMPAAISQHAQTVRWFGDNECGSASLFTRIVRWTRALPVRVTAHR